MPTMINVFSSNLKLSNEKQEELFSNIGEILSLNSIIRTIYSDSIEKDIQVVLHASIVVSDEIVRY